jgi:hypothetical protein
MLRNAARRDNANDFWIGLLCNVVRSERTNFSVRVQASAFVRENLVTELPVDTPAAA